MVGAYKSLTTEKQSLEVALSLLSGEEKDVVKSGEGPNEPPIEVGENSSLEEKDQKEKVD